MRENATTRNIYICWKDREATAKYVETVGKLEKCVGVTQKLE